MIIRALDNVGDWEFGKGRNNYKSGIDACAENLKTRISSFLGDCFFSLGAGIDWFNLLGAKNQIALRLAVGTTIINTQDVTGIQQLSFDIDALRVVRIRYKVQTTFGQISDIYQYDVGA